MENAEIAGEPYNYEEIWFPNGRGIIGFCRRAKVYAVPKRTFICRDRSARLDRFF